MPDDIRAYHRASKHHFDRYARSPGYMDWANQPAPFRFYEGAAHLRLPLAERDPPVGHLGLYAPGAPAAPVDRAAVAGFLELSMGLSAWKAAGGSRWPLRMNPSSGNLHPTELHLVIPPLADLPGGVYHYDPYHHALERRAEVTAELWRPVNRLLPGGGFFAALTSIFWREAWKYGERAFRYCNHDTGHALAALRVAANLFGWRLRLMDGIADAAVERLLGLNRPPPEAPLDREEVELLAWVGPGEAEGFPASLPEAVVAAFAALDFQGRPNRLSRAHVHWEAITRAARAARKPETAASGGRAAARPFAAPDRAALAAAAVIRKRRSATDFDRGGSIAREDFLAMLDKTLPRGDAAPFDAGLGAAEVHLLIFVHAVRGLAPGLYGFLRREAHREELRRLLRPDFRWDEIEPGLPLFLLQPGDFRRTAARVSCHQEIAGDSAFSLGMLGRFDERLSAELWRYRRLFWEAGMIGQVLYLEAEAHGARGTGIGCYFDDAVHELAGLAAERFQSLYHFTVGIPLEDPRLATFPPYSHLGPR
jgi:SagB-type dehydrogenase family enzyme